MTDTHRGGHSGDCTLSPSGDKNTASVNPWMDNLLSKRLIFVMGKGGVGKTTLSIALALVAVRLNKKVLLVELGDTDSIGKLYGNMTLSEVPVKLRQGFWGARIDAKSELEAYVHAHVPSKFIAGKISRSRLFEYLFEAAPGLKEVMSLGRLWRWEKNSPDLPDTSFDLIIVDSPATGHALSLLRLPDLLISMIRVGPLAGQLRAVQHLLKNHQKTAIALVTLPEELPVNETVELVKTAKNSLDMNVGVTFINSVYPDIFSREEICRIQSLRKKIQNRASETERAVLLSAFHFICRQMAQQKHIRKLYAALSGPVQKIPFYFTNDMSLTQIEDLSYTLCPVSGQSG